MPHSGEGAPVPRRGSRPGAGLGIQGARPGPCRPRNAAPAASPRATWRYMAVTSASRRSPSTSELASSCGKPSAWDSSSAVGPVVGLIGTSWTQCLRVRLRAGGEAARAPAKWRRTSSLWSTRTPHARRVMARVIRRRRPARRAARVVDRLAQQAGGLDAAGIAEPRTVQRGAHDELAHVAARGEPSRAGRRTSGHPAPPRRSRDRRARPGSRRASRRRDRPPAPRAQRRRAVAPMPRRARPPPRAQGPSRARPSPPNTGRRCGNQAQRRDRAARSRDRGRPAGAPPRPSALRGRAGTPPSPPRRTSASEWSSTSTASGHWPRSTSARPRIASDHAAWRTSPQRRAAATDSQSRPIAAS